MTVDLVRARLTALEAQIAGIRTAYPDIPRNVLEVELPAFMTFVGRATYETTTFGDQRMVENREYTLRLVVKTASLGIEGEGEDDVTAFIPLVQAFFMARPQLALNATSTVFYNSRLTGDSGVIQIAHPSDINKRFLGVDFTLQVFDTLDITYT